MKKVLLVLFLVLTMAVMSFGQEGTGSSGGGTGSIGRLTTFTYSFMTNIAWTIEWAGITLGDYGAPGSPANYTIADYFTVSNLSTNYDTEVQALCSAWTVPAAYPTTGNKHPNNYGATASGLWLQVGAGTTFGDLTNGMSSMTELGSSGQACVTSSDAQGVWENDFTGDIQFELEAGVDVAGDYAVTVTLNVWEASEAPL
jgi:hypothetical protein